MWEFIGMIILSTDRIMSKDQSKEWQFCDWAWKRYGRAL